MQARRRTDVDYRLDDEQRLEILFPHAALRGLRYTHDARQPAVLFCEHVYNDLRLPIFKGMQHNGFRFA